MALVTIIVYGQGYQRTFAIGALTFVGSLMLPISPVGYPFYYFFDMFDYVGDNGTAFRCYALIGVLTGILLAAAFGLLAVIVRRMIGPVPSTTENRPDGPTSDDPQGPFG